MFLNLKHDFQRVYNKTSYKGKVRKVFACLGAQGFQAVMSYRICRWLVSKHIPFLHLFIQRFIEITTGISIPPEANIGKGLLINHFGGIVINDGTKIGDFCTISHCVTIGNKKPGGKSPIIGNNVYICVGAKVLGEIVIGNNCIIGANAVVLDSVSENSIVAGMPAKVIKTFKNKSEYKEFYYEE
jgi:serine O-acetyltransferase